MIDSRKKIIVDANILISAVLGKRVRSLVDQYADSIRLLAPELAFTEVNRRLPKIFSSVSDGDKAETLTGEAITDLKSVFYPLGSETFSVKRETALQRIGHRDPDDWPCLAAALALDCPIWTDDQDFFGVGVPIWKTSLVHLFFEGGLP